MLPGGTGFNSPMSMGTQAVDTNRCAPQDKKRAVQ